MARIAQSHHRALRSVPSVLSVSSVLCFSFLFQVRKLMSPRDEAKERPEISLLIKQISELYRSRAFYPHMGGFRKYYTVKP